MCLAVPARIISIAADRTAVVDILGVLRQAALDLVPAAQVDDFVLIHAGFAIEIVSAEDAQVTLDLLKEFPELAEAGY